MWADPLGDIARFAEQARANYPAVVADARQTEEALMGKARGVTRTRFPGGERRRPKRDHDTVARDRHKHRLENNWRIVRTEDGEVLALEPGRDFEQTFEGGPDPFWDAVEYAARCLRGEADPTS